MPVAAPTDVFGHSKAANGRGVAQPGSASHWGCGGRWFESSRPDHPSSIGSSHLRMTNPTLLMQQTSDGTTQLLLGIAPWLLIFVVFYMLMIRPQQRRVKEHQAAINAVKKGDEVITAGGIRGRVTKVNDEDAEVEIATGVKVRVIKSTLSQVLSPNAKPAND